MQPALAGPLFTRILKGGRITAERLSDQGVYHILDIRRQQANMASFTPHDLRRTFAGDLLDAGVDLSTVQKLMGHANANTTSGYDRRGAPKRARPSGTRCACCMCRTAGGSIHKYYEQQERK
jgi:integrase/recombinase XerD